MRAPRGRQAIRATILDSLRIAPGMSKIGLARALRLSPSTVSLAVRTLQDDGIVVSGGSELSGGRPAERLRLNPDRPLMLGIDLGETEALLGVVNLEGVLIARETVTLDARDGVVRLGPVLAAAAQFTRKISDISGVGVAVPGLIDRALGTVRFAANLGWVDMPLQDRIAAELGIPVVVERNTNAALLGEEWWGLRPAADPLVFVTIGSGIGAAIRLGGQFLDGASGAAGEFGHIPVFGGTRMCRCGNRGCLESEVSSQAIAARYGSVLGTGVRSVFVAAEHGDATAIRAIETTAVALGSGIATLVSLFNPQLIVLGGEFMEADDRILPIVREQVRSSSLPQSVAAVSIVRSALGEQGSVIGAATLGFHRLFHGPEDEQIR